MREIFYIEDTLANRVSYYLLLAFLAALPFDRFYSEWALACLLIHTLIQWKGKRPFRIRPSFLWVISIYVLTMAGSIYSPYREAEWKDWEKQLALVLFPLIFTLTSLDLKKVKLPLLKGFAFSCLFAVLFLYEEAFRLIRFNGLSLRALFTPPFMNHNFSAPLDIHATYLSVYITISLVTFVYLFFRSRSVWARVFFLLAFLLLVMSLLQLASRAVCVAAWILLGSIPFFLLKKRPARIFSLIAIFGAACFLWAVTRSDPFNDRYLAGVRTFKDRYILDLREDLRPGMEGEEGPQSRFVLSDSRMVRWQSAWELVRASPWIGYGTGAEEPLLMDKYFEHRLYSSYINKLNAHNEFISILLRTGLAGLLVWLCLLGKGFSAAIRSGDPFFYAFLVLVICVCFSENMLDVNKGIFLFGFFFPFFFAASPAVIKNPAERQKKTIKYIVGWFYKPLLIRWLSETRTYVYQDIMLRIPPGVFHPGFFFSTRLLLNYISRQPLGNSSFLELGAGSGLISFYAEKSGARVTATDINPGAIANLHANSRLNGCSIEIIHSDLFQAIPDRTFDIIVINPPYYKKMPRDDAGYAWYCGENGEFFSGLFSGLERFTHTNSSVWMVLSEDCDMGMILGFAEKHGWIARCVYTKRNLLEKNFIYTFAREFNQSAPDPAYGNKNILPLVGA